MHMRDGQSGISSEQPDEIAPVRNKIETSDRIRVVIAWIIRYCKDDPHYDAMVSHDDVNAYARACLADNEGIQIITTSTRSRGIKEKSHSMTTP